MSERRLVIAAGITGVALLPVATAHAVACMRSLCGSCIQSLRVFEEWHSEEVLHHSGGGVPMSHIKPNGTRKRF